MKDEGTVAELCVRTGAFNLVHDRGGTLCPRWSTKGVFGQSRAFRATLFEYVQVSVLGGVRRHDTLRPLTSTTSSAVIVYRPLVEPRLQWYTCDIDSRL